MPTPPVVKKSVALPVKPVVRKPVAPVRPPAAKQPVSKQPVVAIDRLERSEQPAFVPRLTRAQQRDADAAEAARKEAAEPPVMAAAEAVTAALAGQAVRLAPAAADAPRWAPRPGLALRELPPLNGRRSFDVGLAGARFTVVAPVGAEPTAMLARLVAIVADVPEDVRATIRRVDVRQSLEQGAAYAVEVTGADGKPEIIDVARTALIEGRATYAVADRHGRFELITTQDARDGWEVAQAFHLWALIPPAMRSALQTIKVEDGANPTDAHFAEAYKLPDFVSAASAANGLASFWHGTKHLEADTFLHEFGHVLGQTYSTKNELVPDGWPEAVSADARGVSKYGDTNPTEDFAESFGTYVTLLRGRPVRQENPPKDLADFRGRWPARAALLDAMFTGEIRPATK